MGIVVCVPFFDPHPLFLPHFIEFYAANKAKHKLQLAWSSRRPLHNAQHDAVRLALDHSDFTHVLFVEDDHWGFPVDGIERLLEDDLDVVGFHTFSRKPPFHSLCMRRRDKSLPIDQACVLNMTPFERISVDEPLIQETDLLSWGMTLVRTSVFRQIDGDPFECWGKVPTDSVFCELCERAGIKRHVDFSFHLPHGDVTQERRVPLLRVHEYEKALGLQGYGTGRPTGGTLSGTFFSSTDGNLGGAP